MFHCSLFINSAKSRFISIKYKSKHLSFNLISFLPFFSLHVSETIPASSGLLLAGIWLEGSRKLFVAKILPEERLESPAPNTKRAPGCRFFEKKPSFAPNLPPGAIGAPRCARAPRRALFALLTT
ncbi:hypothetical protein Hanom_Chr15g01368211 [Helianthus anomalus]